MATGGGASIFFARPEWQSGAGVPADNARHVPDIAFAAAVAHDPYQIYTGGAPLYVGGTSAPTPVFSGMLALLNQYLVSSGAQSQPGLETSILRSTAWHKRRRGFFTMSRLEATSSRARAAVLSAPAANSVMKPVLDTIRLLVWVRSMSITLSSRGMAANPSRQPPR